MIAAYTILRVVPSSTMHDSLHCSMSAFAPDTLAGARARAFLTSIRLPLARSSALCIDVQRV